MSVHYSENGARKKLESMLMFNKSMKDIKVVKKTPKKRGAYKVPKSERKPRTLEGII